LRLGVSSIVFGLMGGAIVGATTAFAQETVTVAQDFNNQNIQVFAPAYFEKFQINNAFEMVTRVPVFSFNQAKTLAVLPARPEMS